MSDILARKEMLNKPNLSLLTRAECAAILSVSLETVSNWIQEGALPATRLGSGRRLLRIRLEDLEAFIERGKVVTEPPEGAQEPDEQDHE